MLKIEKVIITRSLEIAIDSEDSKITFSILACLLQNFPSEPAKELSDHYTQRNKLFEKFGSFRWVAQEQDIPSTVVLEMEEIDFLRKYVLFYISSSEITDTGSREFNLISILDKLVEDASERSECIPKTDEVDKGSPLLFKNIERRSNANKDTYYLFRRSGSEEIFGLFSKLLEENFSLHEESEEDFLLRNELYTRFSISVSGDPAIRLTAEDIKFLGVYLPSIASNEHFSEVDTKDIVLLALGIENLRKMLSAWFIAGESVYDEHMLTKLGRFNEPA